MEIAFSAGTEAKLRSPGRPTVYLLAGHCRACDTLVLRRAHSRELALDEPHDDADKRPCTRPDLGGWVTVAAVPW